MSETRAIAVHFHYGARLSGVGLFIDKIFTDERLPWAAVHISGDDVSSSGRRYPHFFSAIKLLSRRPETLIFAHTLKAGLAASLVKFSRRVKVVYVGHGVRYHQRRRTLAERIKYVLAENVVSLMADAIVHLRQTDIDQAKEILVVDCGHKTFLMAPKLAPPC